MVIFVEFFLFIGKFRSKSVLNVFQKFLYEVSTSSEFSTSVHSRLLRVSRKFSTLDLEKFRVRLNLGLLFDCKDGNSMNNGKWSLMSEIITPLVISGEIMLVSIWSMSDNEWLWILVTYSIHWKKLLSFMVAKYWF